MVDISHISHISHIVPITQLIAPSTTDTITQVLALSDALFAPS